MTNKEKYNIFCRNTYVPIFSKPFWMDAVCGENNWDVWLYISGGNVLAAMPYYIENRNGYKYITKAPFTQTNGIIFSHDENIKLPTKSSQEEKIINKACEFIQHLGIDVYEQQYTHSFNNWSPFFWNGYDNILRYTYVVPTSNSYDFRQNFSSNVRKNLKKGVENGVVIESQNQEMFYEQYSKIYEKQGLNLPLSRELWERIFEACTKNECAKILFATDSKENITSLVYVVEDAKYMYYLAGGAIAEYSNLQTFTLLIDHCMQLSQAKNLDFDFEGSMIKRIAKSFREFGGIPKPYYRIRKIFNPDILNMEHEEKLKKLEMDE